MEDEAQAQGSPLVGRTMGLSWSSTLTGVGLAGQSEAVRQAPTWVSTGSAGWPRATLRTTLAVFRPTPGRSPGRPCDGHLAVEGLDQPTWPCRYAAGLGGEEPGGPDELLHVARVRSRQIGGRQYRAKSAGVTMFTASSVVCAERIVAVSSSGRVQWGDQLTARYRAGVLTRQAAVTSRARPLGLRGRPVAIGPGHHRWTPQPRDTPP